MPDLTELAQHCRIVFADHGALLWTLFFGGLIGSATHCSGMCGPFVLSQTASALDHLPLGKLSEWQRMRGAMLIPYHLGRMTTYTLLGVLAALTTVYLKRAPWFHDLAAFLLGLAGALFFIQALRLTRLALPRIKFWFALPVPAAVKALLKRLFIAPVGWHGYALGLMLGFLPCGLVYAALVAVAAHGSPVLAVPGMVMFSLGTLPVLMMTGFGLQFFKQRLQRVMVYAAPLLMFINSLSLFFIAGDVAR